jgi:hypothetical protein
MKIFKNANFVINYQNFQNFSKINTFNILWFRSTQSMKKNNNVLNYEIFSKSFSTINKIDLNFKKRKIYPVSSENLPNYSFPKKFKQVQESEIQQELSQDEKQMVEYLKQFLSLKAFIKINKNINKKIINKSEEAKKNQINLVDFIQCKEFLEANFNLLNNNYKKSEEIFFFIKNILRKSGYLGTYINNINLRRLGISKIMQNKIREGLLELENVYEYSKEKEYFNPKYRFDSMKELLKTYILYFPSKSSNFSDKIINDNLELKLLNLNQIAELNHYISVRNNIRNFI